MVCYLHDHIVHIIEDESWTIQVLIYRPWNVEDSYNACLDKTQSTFQVNIYNGGWIELKRLHTHNMHDYLTMQNKDGELVTKRYSAPNNSTVS